MVLGEIEGRGEWLVLGNILYYDIPLSLSLSVVTQAKLCSNSGCFDEDSLMASSSSSSLSLVGFCCTIVRTPHSPDFVLFCFKNGGIMHSTTRSFDKRWHCKNDHVFETTVTLWNDNYILKTTSSRVIQKWAKNDKKR